MGLSGSCRWWKWHQEDFHMGTRVTSMKGQKARPSAKWGTRHVPGGAKWSQHPGALRTVDHMPIIPEMCCHTSFWTHVPAWPSSLPKHHHPTFLFFFFFNFENDTCLLLKIWKLYLTAYVFLNFTNSYSSSLIWDHHYIFFFPNILRIFLY